MTPGPFGVSNSLKHVHLNLIPQNAPTRKNPWRNPGPWISLFQISHRWMNPVPFCQTRNYHNSSPFSDPGRIHPSQAQRFFFALGRIRGVHESFTGTTCNVSASIPGSIKHGLLENHPLISRIFPGKVGWSCIFRGMPDAPACHVWLHTISCISHYICHWYAIISH